MTRLRSPLAAFAALLLAACGAPLPGGPAGEDQAPIVGGVDDLLRGYVVGVGGPYDPSNPGNPGAGPFCSGTLISRRTVLTAGHCFTAGAGPRGGLTAVFFGPVITSPLPASAKVVGTVRAVLHPGFDATTLTHDLALVELAEDAPSQAVPLLRETMANTAEFLGPRYAFAGYGNDGKGDYGVRRVATFAIDRVGPACVGLDTKTGPIDATEFYYRVAGKNTCDGDSGGPALLPRGAVERLAGATSSGDELCVKDGADARTDAPEIAAFIQPTLDLFEGADPCRADGVCDESCNAGHRLVDPDCAPAHCGKDGVCVLSCVEAPDPDCPAVDHCGADGVCDARCPADPDCEAAPAPVPSGEGGACDGGKGHPGSLGAGGASGQASDAGTAGERASPRPGCGCRAAGANRTRREGSVLLVVGLGALLARRRPRARAVRFG